ncbi:MAG TPA: carboxyltransferase domain-containing protein [Devosiaceae bacterium]|jgi:KipI family sensor histidine kinase inhibitor
MIERLPLPMLIPMGDAALLVRFDDRLSEAANGAAVAFARRLSQDMPQGVAEIDPNLVSVLLRYDPAATSFEKLAGEIRLMISASVTTKLPLPATHRIAVRFGGEDGPDLQRVSEALHLDSAAFIAAHNAAPLRVLTTGFAPGFVYCGFHDETLRLPRRVDIRARIPAGSILFAAGQTAIAATSIPTGWHVIGRTSFRNFDPAATPPTRLREGDKVIFTAGAA